MTLTELAASLGITNELSESFYKSYEKIKDATTLYERDYLIRIQKEYALFEDDKFEALLKSFDDFSQNESLVKWAILARQELMHSEDHDSLYGMPMPTRDGSLGRDMIALFPLLSLFEDAVKKYESLGFSREEYMRELKSLSSCMASSEDGAFYFPNRLFGWCALYIYATIFRHGVLNFEINEIFDPVIVLENKNTKERVILMTEGVFHRSGSSLLSAGLSEDKEGSFNAALSETDSEYVGYSTKYGYIVPERKIFNKSEWKKVLGKGDVAVSLHIPRGVDVSRESVKETVKQGMRIVRERYGEHIKFAYCRSWLLSPNISQCLPSTSKIIEFENCFERYPIKSTGKELMSFLFGKSVENYEELPENTSLQKKVKQIYLDGNFIYAGAGIIIEDEFYI